MKIYIYIFLKNKKILKRLQYICPFCSRLKKLVDCSWRSVKYETIVFNLGQRIYLIFQFSTNFIDHNDETGHFIKHDFLVLILKVNVKREI